MAKDGQGKGFELLHITVTTCIITLFKVHGRTRTIRCRKSLVLSKTKKFVSEPKVWKTVYI